MTDSHDPQGGDADVVGWLQELRPPAPKPELREKVLAARPPRGRPWAELAVILALAAGLGANASARRDACERLDLPHAKSALEREAESLVRHEDLDMDEALTRRLVAALARRPRATGIRID